MPRVIVIPSVDDQILVDNGKKPESHFDRSFDTEKELESYLAGIEAMDDLVECEILKEDALHLKVKIGSEKTSIGFATAGEKAAYKQGLEDGDGWRRPQVVTEKDFDFEEVAELVDGKAPKP